VNIDDFNLLLPIVQAGTSLLASGPPSAGAVGAAEPLTRAELEAVAAAAVVRWREIVDDAEALALLDAVSFQIADLEGLRLGQVAGTTVWIDVDAAGRGWFVDTTPRDDREFRRRPGDGTLHAGRRSEAYGDMDLLSAVTHELCHVLGLHHDTDARSLLSGLPSTLAPGTRVLPGAEAAPAGGQRGENVRVARSAEIAGGVSLGDCVRVQAGARIGEETSVGAGCVIGKGAVIGARARLGAGVVVEPGASIPDGSVVLAGTHVGALNRVHLETWSGLELREALRKLLRAWDSDRHPGRRLH
jgi:hypothetical protein